MSIRKDLQTFVTEVQGIRSKLKDPDFKVPSDDTVISHSSRSTKKAANGSEEAADKKGIPLTKEIVVEIALTDEIRSIYELHLARRNLNDVTDTLPRCANLKYLNLSSNLLSTFPSSVSKGLSNLQELCLDNNLFTSIPAGVCELPSLHTLSLSHNALGSGNATIPEAMKRMGKLTSLSLSCVALKDFSGFEYVGKLTYLDVSNNGLTSLKGLENLQKLTEIDLDYNKIKSLDGLEKLTELKILSCSNNEIKGVSSLATSVKSIPSPFRTLRQLTTIDLSNNTISSLAMFTTMTSVVSLSLASNAFGVAECEPATSGPPTQGKEKQSKDAPPDVSLADDDSAAYVTDDDEASATKSKLQPKKKSSTTTSTKSTPLSSARKAPPSRDKTSTDPSALTRTNSNSMMSGSGTFLQRLAGLFPNLASLDLSDNNTSIIPNYAALSALQKCTKLVEFSCKGTLTSERNKDSHVRGILAYLPDLEMLDGSAEFDHLKEQKTLLTDVSGEGDEWAAGSRPMSASGSRPGTANGRMKRPTSAGTLSKMTISMASNDVVENDFLNFKATMENFQKEMEKSVEKMRTNICKARESMEDRRGQVKEARAKAEFDAYNASISVSTSHSASAPVHRVDVDSQDSPSSVSPQSSVTPTSLVPSPPQLAKRIDLAAALGEKPEGPNSLGISTFQRDAKRHQQLWKLEEEIRREELLSQVSSEPPKVLIQEHGTQNGTGVSSSYGGRDQLNDTMTSSTACSPMKFEDDTDNKASRKFFQQSAKTDIIEKEDDGPVVQTDALMNDLRPSSRGMLERTHSAPGSQIVSKGEAPKGYNTRRVSKSGASNTSSAGQQTLQTRPTANASVKSSVTKSLNSRVKK